MTICRYWIEKQTDDHAFEFECDDELAFEFEFDNCGLWAAQAAASDYHSAHDGWESDWPLTFILERQRENGTWEPLGKYEVDRESMPEFYARVLP